jgi:uncharacterized protein HemY
MSSRRRALRRAESRLFEAIEAADAGDLRLAEQLITRAARPRRARANVIEVEAAALRVGRE